MSQGNSTLRLESDGFVESYCNVVNMTLFPHSVKLDINEDFDVTDTFRVRHLRDNPPGKYKCPLKY